jgi:hypothetical protein
MALSQARFRARENDGGHHPTVSAGRALVLYLLPQGQIRFTGA